MKIKVIYPTIEQVDLELELSVLKECFSENVEYDIQLLEFGPESLETEYDTVLAIPDILNKVMEAENQGYDGVFISCFDDPGVRAARELVDIPVVGGFEPAMLLAMGLADNISIITVLADGIPSTEMKIKQMSIADRVTPIRYVDIPVLDLGDKVKLLNKLYEESINAISNDRAQCIVLGCTEMTNVANLLKEKLNEAGYDIPIIDPNFASIQLLESYIRIGLKQSKITYASPLRKKRNWWNNVKF